MNVGQVLEAPKGSSDRNEVSHWTGRNLSKNKLLENKDFGSFLDAIQQTARDPD